MISYSDTVAASDSIAGVALKGCFSMYGLLALLIVLWRMVGEERRASHATGRG